MITDHHLFDDDDDDNDDDDDDDDDDHNGDDNDNDNDRFILMATKRRDQICTGKNKIKAYIVTPMKVGI